MVIVERLVVMISLEKRALQCFQQRAVMDIGVGVVDEYTRLHIALGIDVQITASACDTSTYELSVVLEVHTEDRFLSAHLTDSVVHYFTLFGLQQQLR